MLSRRQLGAVIGAAAVAFAAIVVLSPRGDTALERWKRTQRARGEKLTLAELAPGFVPRTNANFERFLTAVDQLHDVWFDPGQVNYLIYLAPGEARPVWIGTNAGAFGGASISWETVSRAMEANAEALAEVRAALREPIHASEIDYQHSSLSIRNVRARRTAAQWLAACTEYDLNRRDLPSAAEDLGTLLTLAQCHDEDWTLHNQMLRFLVADLATEATWSALASPAWTEAQLSVLQRQWEAPRLLTQLPRTVEFERAWGDAGFAAARTNKSWNQLVRNWGPAGPPQSWDERLEQRIIPPTWRIFWAGADELHYLQAMQRQIELSRQALLHQNWQITTRELGESVPRREEVLSWIKSRRNYWTQALTPNWRRAYQHAFRMETRRSLTVAAIALRRYELRHGRPAPDLAALVPEFLERVPVDFMCGEPLRYRVLPDGEGRLYSVGDDGRDDGGDSQPVDVCKDYWSLWNDRDAVMPRLVLTLTEPAAPPGEIIPLVVLDAAPLLAVITNLARQAQLEVQLDAAMSNHLANPAVTSRLVTARMENITARAALESVLHDRGLELVTIPRTNRAGIAYRGRRN